MLKYIICTRIWAICRKLIVIQSFFGPKKVQNWEEKWNKYEFEQGLKVGVAQNEVLQT